jgi:creatinine amidohydrolase
MSALPRRFWQDMRSEDFDDLDSKQVIAVLPVGAIEQHGPHLAVAVDHCINQGILDRAVALMPDDLPVTILPALPVGKSDEHIAFAGTLTISAETLTRLWFEIGQSVARAGIRKLVLFNSHGGQQALLDVVARALRLEHEMMVTACSWYQLGAEGDLFDAEELRFGIHAGAVETSMMLHLRPDLVDMDKADDFTPLPRQMASEFDQLNHIGAVRIGWAAQDLNPSGACGNATDADAERGAQLVENAAARFVALLAEIDRFPLSRIARR